MIFTLYAVLMLWLVWCYRFCLLCNLAYQQRNSLRLAIGRLNSGKIWHEKFDTYRLVTFDEHLWRLVSFRDPWKAYSVILASELVEAK